MRDLRQYRAYLLSAADKIESVVRFTASDDTTTCIEGDLILQRTGHAIVELYHETRLVWRKEIGHAA